MWAPSGVASFCRWAVAPRNRAGKGPVTTRGVQRRVQGRATTRVAPTMRRGGCCGWRRASVTFPNSLGDVPKARRRGRRPENVREPTTVGAPLVGALRGHIVLPVGGRAAQPGRQGARSRPAVFGVVRRGGRPQGAPLRCGRCGRRNWCRALITFRRFPGDHAGGVPVGRRRGNVREPTTVGAPLVGALRGHIVLPVGGRAAQPGRQGARSRPAVFGVVRRGGRPQGAPLRCGRCGRRNWCRALITFRRFPGDHAGGVPVGRRRGNVREPTTVGAPLVGALRGRIVLPVGGRAAQPDQQGPGHDPRCAGPCGGNGDHKGRPYDAVGRAPPLAPGVGHLSQIPGGCAGGAPEGETT